MQITLQQQVREIYERDVAAHRADGVREVEALRASTATYRGVPIKIGYLPKLFTREGYAYLQENIEQMWRILVQVIREYLEHEDYRRLFGFSPELEQMILNAPRYQTLLPICRLDLFLNEQTGEFQFCEFNADGSSAMNETREMNRIYRDSLMYREVAEHYDQEQFELFDSWAQEFLRICAESGELPARPHVGIVDFLEKGSSRAEFDEFARAFERAGCPAVVAEIRDLTYDGEHLYSADGQLIEAIYRRAVTSDILAHAQEVQPFLAAVRERKVTLVGDFCTQVVHDKMLFRVLHMERTRQFLSPEDWAFVCAHVPYTTVLSAERAQDPKVRGDRDHWILKPEDSYGAHGIYPGTWLDQEQWERALDEHADRHYILQAFVQPCTTDNIDFSEAEPRMVPYSNMAGLYLYGGKLAGIYSRSSATQIISVEGDEHEMITAIAAPRAGRGEK